MNQRADKVCALVGDLDPEESQGPTRFVYFLLGAEDIVSGEVLSRVRSKAFGSVETVIEALREEEFFDAGFSADWEILFDPSKRGHHEIFSFVSWLFSIASPNSSAAIFSTRMGLA